MALVVSDAAAGERARRPSVARTTAVAEADSRIQTDRMRARWSRAISWRRPSQSSETSRAPTGFENGLDELIDDLRTRLRENQESSMRR